MRNRHPLRRGVMTVLFLTGVIALVKGCSLVFPNGFASGSPASYEGIVSVPEEGWDYAVFNSSDSLEENERLRGSGTQISNLTCLESSSARAALAQAVAQAPPGFDGGRDLWVSFVATPRIATGLCMQEFSHGRKNRTHYGTYLEIESVRSARPLGCDYLEFVVNHLRCRARDDEDVPLR